MTRIAFQSDKILRMKQLILDAQKLGLVKEPGYHALVKKYILAKNQVKSFNQRSFNSR